MDNSMRTGKVDRGFPNLQSDLTSDSNKNLSQTDSKVTQISTESIANSAVVPFNPMVTSPIIPHPLATVDVAPVEQKEINFKDLGGYLWMCHEEIPDRMSGGKTHVFRLRDDCNIFQGSCETKWKNKQKKEQLDQQLSPYLELLENMIVLQNNFATSINHTVSIILLYETNSYEDFKHNIEGRHDSTDIDALRFVKIWEKQNVLLRELGYSLVLNDTGVFLHLPDTTKLTYHLAAYRSRNPNFPTLNISNWHSPISGNSIAKDRAFVERFAIGPNCVDVLLDSSIAEGEGCSQYVHSHTHSLMATLSILCNLSKTGAAKFNEGRENFRNIVKIFYNLLIEASKILESHHSSQDKKTITANDLEVAWFTLALFIVQSFSFNDERELGSLTQDRFVDYMSSEFIGHNPREMSLRFEKRNLGSSNPFVIKEIWDKIERLVFE